MRDRAEKVFACIDTLIDELPVPEGHRGLLRVHVGVGREQAQDYPDLPAIQLPLLVHAAITGEERPALPVAAACTLLYLGADLLDNVIDRELPPSWQARDPAEAHLAAATLLAAVPQLALAHLREQGAPPATLWALSQLFAETLLIMSAGEHEDLLYTGREDVDGRMCRAMAERKSGAEVALFAGAGATLATEDAALIEEYAAFGMCLGTSRQILSDAVDIWKGENGRDLLNGKRTLPIVHALCALPDEPRERLLDLLEALRGGAQPYGEVRKILLTAGSVHYTALVADDYRQRASDHLVAASPREPPGSALRAILGEASLLPASERAPR